MVEKQTQTAVAAEETESKPTVKRAPRRRGGTGTKPRSRRTRSEEKVTEPVPEIPTEFVDDGAGATMFDPEAEPRQVDLPLTVPAAAEHATADGAPDRGTAVTEVAPARTTRGRRRTRKADEESAAAGPAIEVAPEVGERGEKAARGRTRGRRGGRRRTAARRGEIAESESIAAATGEREMLINVTDQEEVRIAVSHKGRLEELFMERASAGSHVGNIYKGIVTNVEPSIQAAFVDFGQGKNGFLHISDIQPQYFGSGKTEPENVGRKTPRRERPPIQRCLRRGQEVMVQVTREGIGTKGPTLTTYLSLPGKYLVMMPGMNRLGVSRRIEEEDVRREMRQVLSQLELPKGMGFILRTAGIGQTKRELQADLNYIKRLWKTIADRVRQVPSPAELYRESDLVTRTLRDVCTPDVARIIIDDGRVAEQVREFLAIVSPRARHEVMLYEGKEPLFHKYGIEEEINRINARHVPLPSGGSLVIDQTEALVAIDVNSGRFRDPRNAEETALRINLEAAEEIARQLRLRDLGGLIVCDFIDMLQDRNCRAVETALRTALAAHKERAKILRMSQFGIIEMTRQRQRRSIKRSIYIDCPHCHGSGLIKSSESMTLDVMRMLHLAIHRADVHQVFVRVHGDVASYLLNRKRSAVHALEAATGKRVIILAEAAFSPDQVEIVCKDDRDRIIDTFPAPDEAPRHESPQRQNGAPRSAAPPRR